MSEPAMHDIHPLSAWVQGTMTFHFAGAVVRQRMSQQDARTIQQMISDERSSDDLSWSSTKWFQCDSERILFADFKVDEDYGWPLTVDDRKRLAKRGHHHGLLRTLVEHWASVGDEPSYSALAMAHLHHTAIDQDMTAFKDVAKWVEGEQGTARLRILIDRIKRRVDDTAEPDAAEAEKDESADAAGDDDEPAAGGSGDGSERTRSPSPDDDRED